MYKKVCGISLAGLLVVAPITNAFGAEINASEDAESYSQLINADFIDESAANAMSAYSSSPSETDADSGSIDAEALRGLNIEVPSVSQYIAYSERYSR